MCHIVDTDRERADEIGMLQMIYGDVGCCGLERKRLD
jgi:hypothetical protein